jgi:choline monooxygenase
MNPDERIGERLESASTLSSRFYFGDDVLLEEQRRIFGRTWQLAGRREQAAARGQFFTAVVADEPVLISRGDDGELRAFSNVCRHRAGPVASGEGSCRAFRCGYHGWSYSLEGRLTNTPEFDGVENFSKEDVRLPSFGVEEWLGLIFVNLDPESAPLAKSLETLVDLPARHEFESMTFACRKEWYVDCNWKVYVDNYLEGYHIPIVHPSLMKELDYSRYRTETRRLYSIQHSPIRDSAPGRVRRVGDGEQEAEYYWIYPNLMLNVYPDNFSTNLILPLSPGRTLTVFEWFFREPEKDEVRRKIDETVAFSDEIQLEDIAICEAVQKGLRSATYRRGRYSVRRENGVHHFHRLYSESMGGG